MISQRVEARLLGQGLQALQTGAQIALAAGFEHSLDLGIGPARRGRKPAGVVLMLMLVVVPGIVITAFERVIAGDPAPIPVSQHPAAKVTRLLHEALICVRVRNGAIAPVFHLLFTDHTPYFDCLFGSILKADPLLVIPFVTGGAGACDFTRRITIEIVTRRRLKHVIPDRSPLEASGHLVIPVDHRITFLDHLGGHLHVLCADRSGHGQCHKKYKPAQHAHTSKGYKGSITRPSAIATVFPLAVLSYEPLRRFSQARP